MCEKTLAVEQVIIFNKDGNPKSEINEIGNIKDLVMNDDIVACVEVIKSHSYKFLQINAVVDGENWNNSSAKSDLFKFKAESHVTYYLLDSLPTASSHVFMIQCDEEWKPIPIGVFRCYLATDDSAIFEKFPKGNYIISVFGIRNIDTQYFGSKKISVNKNGTKGIWDDMVDSNSPKNIILDIVKFRAIDDQNKGKDKK